MVTIRIQVALHSLLRQQTLTFLPSVLVVMVVVAMDGFLDQLDAFVFVIFAPGHVPCHFVDVILVLLLLILSESAMRYIFKSSKFRSRLPDGKI